jgi:hypothetical protein
MPNDVRKPDPRRAYQRTRILAAVQAGPLTAQQVADKLHLSRGGAQWHINGMMAEKPRLLHVAGHARNQEGQRSAPTYGLGDKPDVPFRKARAPKGRVTVDDRYEQIMKKLGARPMTAAEVVDEMLLQRARVYLIDLHAAGRIHVVSWRQDASGAWRSPVYAVGAAADAERPAPQSEHEKCARYWVRLKADPHRHGHYLQRNRMRKNPQTWLSALMG